MFCFHLCADVWSVFHFQKRLLSHLCLCLSSCQLVWKGWTLVQLKLWADVNGRPLHWTCALSNSSFVMECLNVINVTFNKNRYQIFITHLVRPAVWSRTSSLSISKYLVPVIWERQEHFLDPGSFHGKHLDYPDTKNALKAISDLDVLIICLRKSCSHLCISH